MATTAVEQRKQPWLFSPTVDLLTFAGSAVASLVLVGLGFQFGWVHSRTPEWTWVTAILLIDVAHVYSTGFRVYFDPTELRRRPWLYSLAPVLSFLVGMAIYSESPLVFWRMLAYLAVFHFVRQQYGWVALYRAKANDRDRIGKLIDSAAIYLATIYPLLHWHANLPREFSWFENVPFVDVPTWLAGWCRPLYWTAMAAYVARSLYRGLRFGLWNVGKDLVVSTTAVCWYVGIVCFELGLRVHSNECDHSRRPIHGAGLSDSASRPMDVETPVDGRTCDSVPPAVVAACLYGGAGLGPSDLAGAIVVVWCRVGQAFVEGLAGAASGGASGNALHPGRFHLASSYEP